MYAFYVITEFVFSSLDLFWALTNTVKVKQFCSTTDNWLTKQKVQKIFVFRASWINYHLVRPKSGWLIIDENGNFSADLSDVLVKFINTIVADSVND